MIFTVGMPNRFSIDEMLEAVEILDEANVHSVLLEDEANYYNVYSLLTLAAKRTHRIVIGTGVTNPLTRHPVITAAAIATVDQISSGRALLGLGAGGTSTMVALGINVQRPVGRLKSVVPILQKLLKGEAVTISEGPYPMQNLKLEISPERKIPIYIAGRGPRILETGGFFGDGVIAGAGLFTPEAMDYAKKNVQRGAEMAGRDGGKLDIIAWAYASVCEEGEKAIDAIARFAYLTVRSAPIEVWKPTGLDISFAEKVKREAVPELSRVGHLVPKGVLDQFGLAGTPSDCRRRIKEMEEAGIDHIGLLIFPVPELGLKGTTKLFVDSVLKDFMNR